jgi:hypothetical protein
MTAYDGTAAPIEAAVVGCTLLVGNNADDDGAAVGCGDDATVMRTPVGPRVIAPGLVAQLPLPAPLPVVGAAGVVG